MAGERELDIDVLFFFFFMTLLRLIILLSSISQGD